MADYLVTDTELTSIADAIRTKGGTNASLAFPSGFISAIGDIQTGTTPTGTISISSNGTYNVEAFAQAEVVVPTLSLASLSVSQNGTYTPSSGYAFDSVVVDVAGGGSEDNLIDDLIAREISGAYTNSNASLIGYHAFFRCVNLAEVNFLNATVMSDAAFYSCEGLITASFSKIASIPLSCFQNCRKLVNVSFPVATNIGTSAFAGCWSLANIYMPELTSISMTAFQSCSSLSIVSFSKITSIAQSAFAVCKNLVSAFFTSVTYISQYAFTNAEKLKDVSFPEVTYIGNSAFQSCKSLPSLEFSKIESINQYTFANCTSVSTAKFLNVRQVYGNGFRYCQRMHTVILSNTAEGTEQRSIGTSAFFNCYKLLSLYLLSTTSIYALVNANAFNSTPISTYTTSTGGVNGSVFVPSSLYASYTTATNWTTYSARIVSLTDAQIQNVITYGKHDP